MTAVRLWTAALAAATLLACSDSPTSTDSAASNALRFLVVSGSDQTAQPGQELPNPVVVRVVDGSNAPIPDHVVNFRVTEGGGTVFAGTAATDRDGIAREWWTLGSAPGRNTLEVRAVDPVTGEKRVYATFVATAIDPAQVASSVTVTPATASVVAGATTTLQAVARNSAGTIITGRQFTWTSSNAAIARVDSLGVVTGVAAGSATVTATLDGRSGSSAVTVTSVTTTPPPPSGSVIFSEGFESGSFATWDDGYDASRHAILTDAALAHSGNRVLRITYPAGGNGGFLNKFFMPGYDSVRVSYWIKFADNWQGGTYLVGLYGSPINNMWGAFGKAGICPNGRDFFNNFLYAEPNGNPGDTRFYSYFPAMSRTGGCYGDNGTTTGASYFPPLNMSRGAWHEVTLDVRANTIGQSNGAVRMFIDGQKRGEWVNLRYRETDSLRINALQITANVAGGSPQTQLLYVDDIVVSGGNVSGGGGTTPPPTSPTVATVSVSPGTSTIQVGQATTLTAQTLSSTGTVITGQAVTWSSSNTAVATVSSTGVVIGQGAGTATIAATSSGITGRATVTVTSTTTVPPATGTVYSNEPTGMRFTSDAPFNSLTEGGWRPEPAHASGRFGITTDAAAPRSPSNVLEFVYPAGFTSGGYSPGTVRAPAPFPDARGTQNIREIFWAYHFKANAGWQNHASNVNKLGYGWLNDATTFGIVWHWGRTQRPAQDYMKQMAIFIAGSYFMFNTAEAVPVEPGQWYKVEVQIRPSSATGRADGIVRVWINGVLSANHLNVVTAAGYISDVYWSPTWGGSGGSNKLQEDFVRFDHTRISAR